MVDEITKTSCGLEVGDIVTREGSDLQVVINVWNDISITVVCVKEPLSGYCGFGEKEDNLARRYTLVKKAFN